jgi:uncharacterized membrane-anchored protein
MRTKGWRWFALALPLLVLGLGILRGERAIRAGEPWHFDIGGYDPRDLLRGHYLRFTVEEQWGDPLDGSVEEADCACLERTPGGAAPILHPASCSFARESCDSFVVRAELDRLDRFYIPEARAQELEERLQDAATRDAAQILVRIDRKGTPVLVDLLIDGKPVAE